MNNSTGSRTRLKTNSLYPTIPVVTVCVILEDEETAIIETDVVYG
jgi:hypothetical protein